MGKVQSQYNCNITTNQKENLTSKSARVDTRKDDTGIMDKEQEALRQSIIKHTSDVQKDVMLIKTKAENENLKDLAIHLMDAVKQFMEIV